MVREPVGEQGSGVGCSHYTVGRDLGTEKNGQDCGPHQLKPAMLVPNSQVTP